MYTEVSDADPRTLFRMQGVIPQAYYGRPLRLSFWYSLYGQHMGNFNVFAANAAGQMSLAYQALRGKRDRE